MEWVALALWITVFLIALPLAKGALRGIFSLGLQALAAGAGLALIIIYICLDEPSTLAWVASGVALIGALAVLVAAATLTSDEEPVVSASIVTEEIEAGLAGLQLPFFLVTLILTAVAALGIGTSA